MVGKFIYSFVGIIAGLLIGILINQIFPFFPDLFSLIVPSFIGGILGIAAAERFNNSLPQVIISAVILAIYFLFFWIYIRPQQIELRKFIHENNRYIPIIEEFGIR